MSNWDAGLVLHIPDNRIRGLKYRARLKYEEYDEKDTVDEFFNLLFKGKFSVEKDKNFAISVTPASFPLLSII